MRKIKLNNKVYPVDISDGKGNKSFGCNGRGGMRIYINFSLKTDNGFVENKRCLDGKVNYKLEKKDGCYMYHIDDERLNAVQQIHDYSLCDSISEKQKIKNIVFGLKYENINYIEDGYRFGKEITFDNFCVCFDRLRLVFFRSSHHGFIAPDYLDIHAGHEDFKKLFKLIKKRILESFDLEKKELSDARG